MADRPIIGITADMEEGRFSLKTEYVSAVLRAGGTPVLIPPSGSPGLYARLVRGLIISGGNDIDPSYYNEEAAFEMKITPRQRTDFEIALFHEIIDMGKPLLGICYGMQLVNVALGGGLYQDIGSEIPKALDHGAGKHDIEVKDNLLIDAGTYRVSTSHHQAVKTLGRGLEAIAHSKDGVIEAACMKDSPFVLCLQWHPERPSKDAISDDVFELFIGASSESQ